MKRSFRLPQMITLFFIGSLLLIGSCSKEKSGNGSPNENDEQASIASSEADGEAEIIFNGVFDDAIGASDDVGMAGTGVFGRVELPVGITDNTSPRPGGCYILTVTHLNTGSVFPVRIVIDFGNTGCQGNDGHIRSGKIITEYSSRLINAGATATCTFEDFYIDSIKVEGTLAINNTSSNNNRQFTIDITDAKLSKTNGNYTKWNSHKTITQIEGLVTPQLALDDVFQIEGGSQGQVKRGNLLVTWESNVTEPLLKKFACRWIVQGKLTETHARSGGNSSGEAVLDFGTGTCDNQATVIINGVSHNITLH